MRKLVGGLTLVVAFIVNPLFACHPFEPSFSYGEAEMKAAVEGTWKLAFRGRELTIRIAQAKAVEQHSMRRALVKSAAACGHRTFVKSAEACKDLSELPLTLVAVNEPTTKTEGRFVVESTTFDAGELLITVDGKRLAAVISPQGKVLRVDDGVTLERLPRG
ncbi:MAG TPA: hypothetical protein VFQ53_22810 [Kofleriaceae bacterium]|nr:hypothetical protein [Kofleriaceae bacterium]